MSNDSIYALLEQLPDGFKTIRFRPVIISAPGGQDDCEHLFGEVHEHGLSAPAGVEQGGAEFGIAHETVVNDPSGTAGSRRFFSPGSGLILPECVFREKPPVSINAMREITAHQFCPRSFAVEKSPALPVHPPSR